MNSQSNQHHGSSHFWSGFSLGAVIGVAGLYFFGTKTGRKNLQKALDLTENLEETITKTMGGVGEEYVEGLAGSETVGQDRVAEQGSIVNEKQSLLQAILRSVAGYIQSSQKKSGTN